MEFDRILNIFMLIKNLAFFEKFGIIVMIKLPQLENE